MHPLPGIGWPTRLVHGPNRTRTPRPGSRITPTTVSSSAGDVLAGEPRPRRSQNTTAYAARRQQAPVDVGGGDRDRAAGRRTPATSGSAGTGAASSSCGMASQMMITMLTSTTATVAPMGCSVSVETNSPTAPSARQPARRCRRSASSSRRPPRRSRPGCRRAGSPSPPPNSASPTRCRPRRPAASRRHAKTTIAAYLTASSRVRPPGTASR